MKNKDKIIELRKFGYLIGLGFPIIIGWLLPAIFGHEFRVWTLWVSPPALIFAFFSPKLLYYPYKIWMALGHCLGYFNSRLILGLVFILVLLPIAIVMKFTGYDPLKKKKSNMKTYREYKSNIKTDFNRIF